MDVRVSDGSRVDSLAGDAHYVLPLDALDGAALPLAGGKAANLGALLRGGLPVPPGFCVLTAAYALTAQEAGIAAMLEEMAGIAAADATTLGRLAARIRHQVLAAPMPADVAAAIRAAYGALGEAGAAALDGQVPMRLSRPPLGLQGEPGEPGVPAHDVPVAVRSSATAEDLPQASFAGQQDTELNVVGVDAVLAAIRRCWASLWTERAVVYRASNGVDQRTVRIAVVVQRMVEARVAGILFTANPVTGHRGQYVIDAGPGLGESIVSGAVNPDHFVVAAEGGAILERRLGDKATAVVPVAGGGTERVALAGQGEAACLTEAEVAALATLGARVAAHFGAPQDLEWAIDGAGATWLTQARPITTLFPLPAHRAGAAEDEDGLRVYLSINVAQGVERPFTPMGMQALRLCVSAVADTLGLPPRDPLAGPVLLVAAADRLFFDLTPALRNRFGRAVLMFALPRMETRSAVLVRALTDDPRLALLPSASWRLALALLRAMRRIGLPPRIALALLRPRAVQRRAARLMADATSAADVTADAGAEERLAAMESLLHTAIPDLFRGLIPSVVAGLLSWRLAIALLGDTASPAERDALLRGLPHNPTTEMDLALWSLVQRLRTDEPAAGAVRTTATVLLAAQYRANELPPLLQQGLAGFLRRYGHRAVAEIDLGLPRWSEDPDHILGMLANYLRLADPALAPDVQFRAGTRTAEATEALLVRRSRQRGRLRGALVRLSLGRARALMGLREAPKFSWVALLARARALLWPVGKELAQAGRLAAPEDIFFLTLPEARAALAGADRRELVRERRDDYQRELRRRHIPRILLSDGSEPGTDAASPPDGALRGTPASAGIVTARARVILDPAGARLEPGEILVAPSTDPGWTPLFLTAGGLVMEMGGPMSHGAVVAREYGIPAVVGVAGATERFASGQRITVDGGAGTIVAVETA